MLPRMLGMLLLMGLLLGGLFGWKNWTAQQQQAAMAAAGPPLATVSSVMAELQEWPERLPTIGTLSAARSVTISAQLAGQIAELAFDSGQTVKQGTVLLRQDISEEQAALAALGAELRLAEIEVERFSELIPQALAAQRDLDAAIAERDRLAAERRRLQAQIDKKIIRAPFSGRLGLRLVDLGEYLQPGTAIVQLTANAGLYADFRLAQRYLPRLAVGQAVEVRVDALPDELFSAEIVAIEPDVDPATRNVRLRARLDSDTEQLQPGMFAAVTVVLPSARQVVVLPQAAVAFSPFGNSIYLIERQGGQARVRIAYVQTGERRGDLVEIGSGLAAGAEVVSAGQMKLRDGAPVRTDNSVPVPAGIEPSPPEA